MGINAELVKIVAGLRIHGDLEGASIIELGAQDVCVVDLVVKNILRDAGIGVVETEIRLAQHLYAALGFQNYSCIDASGQNSSLVFDLNQDILATYGYLSEFDLVTNLGTAEHCFNQYAVFKNIHRLCRKGGVMIHALPAQGNVNHAFFNYHPRFFADLAAANGYQIVNLCFTIDYRSELIPYTIRNYQQWDSHDVLFYAILRKLDDGEFRTPFDGMFASSNKLAGYVSESGNPLETEFSPYLKGGNWGNTKGYDAKVIQPAKEPQNCLRRLFSGIK